MEESNDLATIVRASGLESTKAQYLLDNFTEYFAIAADWETKARAIVVTDEKQITEMKMAREGRLFLRQKRLDVEKARKTLKEQALREGKAIDGIANILKALIVPIEEYLDEQEHYVERKREAEARERAKEEEQLRIEKEERERKEREAEEARIRAENERLRKEAAAKERQLQEERRAAEAEQRKLREEQARKDAEALKERRAHELQLAEERKRLEAESTRREQELAEERRKMQAMIKCPKCGHKFAIEADRESGSSIAAPGGK